MCPLNQCAARHRLLNEDYWKNLSLPLAENDRGEKGVFQEHWNQFKTSKTMLPRRKREPREAMLEENQWSHCLKKIKDIFSWAGANRVFTNTWWDTASTLRRTHTVNKHNIRKNISRILFLNSDIFPNASNLTSSALKNMTRVLLREVAMISCMIIWGWGSQWCCQWNVYFLKKKNLSTQQTLIRMASNT